MTCPLVPASRWESFRVLCALGTPNGDEMALKIGIVTPIIHMNPRFDPPGWEATGSVEDVAEVVRAAERAGVTGFRALSTSDPRLGLRRTRGPPQCLSTLGFLAAKTERVRLLARMVVLPYHHPLELVKRLGTLDLFSHGRVVVGVGVGLAGTRIRSPRPSIRQSGERSDDFHSGDPGIVGCSKAGVRGHSLQVLRIHSRAVGCSRQVKVWVGGRTRRSLRRAVELGHAWMPFGLKIDELKTILQDDAVRKLIAQRAEPLDLIFAPEPLVDPVGDPDATRETFRAYAAIGATGLSLRFVHDRAATTCSRWSGLCRSPDEIDILADRPITPLSGRASHRNPRRQPYAAPHHRRFESERQHGRPVHSCGFRSRSVWPCLDAPREMTRAAATAGSRSELK